MLRSVKELRGYTIHAQNGDIGRVEDFYFHDDTWAVRYLVVATERWAPGRKVLVATPALGKPNWEQSSFPVALTCQQVEDSPDIDTDQPVSRQQEIELHNYYGWPGYWNDPATGAWPALTPLIEPIPPQPCAPQHGDSHLRSARVVSRYRVHATDGDIGRIRDLIVDDGPWILRYAAVHTAKWLPAKNVLIPTAWFQAMGPLERRLTVNLTRATLQACPEYHAAAGVTRDDEERLYRYYGRPPYWQGSEDSAQAA
jgi:hypothetical protein